LADVYVSTHWHVKDGRGTEFVDLWRDALTWTQDNFAQDGFERARLLRDEEDGSHFVSFLEWDNRDVVRRWSDDPEKQRRQTALGELCDEVHGSGYDEATRVG
jgi:heme-degrading monooxygenase HmoA